MAKGQMFIRDDELRARLGAEADAVIAALDADHKTQKGLATRPADARYRPAVEAKIKQLRG